MKNAIITNLHHIFLLIQKNVLVIENQGQKRIGRHILYFNVLLEIPAYNFNIFK